MMEKRRQYTSEFKVKLVLELLREEKTVGELAAHYQINPNQITRWRSEFLEKAPELFDDAKTTKARKKAEEAAAKEKNRLLKTIGQLTMERDFLQEVQAIQTAKRGIL